MRFLCLLAFRTLQNLNFPEAKKKTSTETSYVSTIVNDATYGSIGIIIRNNLQKRHQILSEF